MNPKTVTLSQWEYNLIMNRWSALERAVELLLLERGDHYLQIGNVAVYLASDGGADGMFVNEQGERLRDLDYALMEKSGAH